MKILITGGTGFLGAKLMTVLSKDYEVGGTCLTKKERNCVYLDITNENQVNSILTQLRPDIVIHTVAISAPDLCESEKEKAWKVNVEGTKNVVDACKANGCKLVYISTDYVFDGEKGNYTEDDEPKPVNYYGLTKLEGERLIQNNLANYLILRLPIFYGFNDEEDRPSFVTKIVDELRNGRKVYLDDNQIRYPVWIDDVALVTNELIKRDAQGIYHFSGKKTVTKFQWALKIADVYKLLSKNICRAEPQGKAKRPHNSRLDTSKIERLGVEIKPVGIEEGLTKTRKQMGCLFRLIYSVRPDMLVLKQNASTFRIEIGKRLAEEEPVSADIVVGIPESGIFPATGYAARSQIPFYPGIIRDYYTQRTIFDPDQETRLRNIRAKLIAIPNIVRDRKIVLVDEAIISGSTLSVAINKLKATGAKEIHVRIPSPPMLSNCHNGVLNPNAELISPRFGSNKDDIEGRIAGYLKCNSLKFLSLEYFLSLLHPDFDPCFECFKLGRGMAQ